MFLSAAPTWAEGTLNGTAQVIPSIPFQQGPTDPEELEAFLDGVITAQLDAYHIPGATVAVVKDGKLLFSKGYGYADIENRKPVIANQTIFRIGSTSKLFTWTAVMQLAEQGKLDLNADVNMYLKDFKIPDTYPSPITLTHLMTHTPGFEERNRIMAHSADEIEPLGNFLAQDMPARVRPPGGLSAYSNYGTALAGYIVEQVSGMPFEQYVEENILKPLDMYNGTFQQPLPSYLQAEMAVGYTYKGGTYRQEPFEYVKIPPAGAMSSTATDMANFMIAHLQDGRYGNSSVLQDATAKKMHSQLFTHDQRVSGWAYGFYEFNLNDQRMIQHGGDTPLFHTLLTLLPEHNIGMFVSYNSLGEGAGAGKARDELLEVFLDRYYPAPVLDAPKPISEFKPSAERFAGSYRMTRSAYTTFEKIINLLSEYKVTSNLDGTLQGPMGESRLVEVEPLLFRPVGGKPSFDGLVFREDGQGRITHFFYLNVPFAAFEKVEWFETSAFNYSLLGICVMFFLSAVVWPIGFFIGRSGKSRISHPLPRIARWLAGGVSVLNLLFLIGLLITLMNPFELGYSVPPILIASLSIALLAALMTVGLIIFTVLAWKNKYWGFVGRLHYTLITLAALAFIWFLNYWNLLGFRF